VIREKAKAAQNILSYLQKNPDTLEGIMKWWPRNEYAMHEVQEALSELISAGLVVERRGKNSHVYYRKSDGPGWQSVNT
jgi:hypothetical protein